MQNSMAMFTFSALEHWYLFLVNSVQKKQKITSLTWNFVTRLIWICIIQWWCICFAPKKHFFGKFGPKFKIVSLSWNLVISLFRVSKLGWGCSIFLFYTLFCKFCPRKPFGTLMLRDWSPSSLLAQTWNQWLFLHYFKDGFCWGLLNLNIFLFFCLWRWKINKTFRNCQNLYYFH